MSRVVGADREHFNDPAIQRVTCTLRVIGLGLILGLPACSAEPPPQEPVARKAQPLPPGLVAAYAFDEGSGTTFADASGNALHGILDGQTWVSGRYGSGLTFSSNLASVPDSSLLDFTSALTVSAWVNPAVEHTVLPMVVMKEGAPGSLAYNYALSSGWSYEGDPAGAGGFIYTGGGQYYGVFGEGQRPPGKWTHLAYTYDGTELSIFVNGELANAIPLAVTPVLTDGPLRIGGTSLWNQFFNGTIDEVRLYGRALAQEEIQFDMYTGVNDTTPAAIALVAPESDTVVWGESVLTKVFVRDSAVARVQFLVDGSPVGAEDTSPPFEGTWDSTLFPNGAHSIGAQARDGAGTLLSTSSVPVTVKNGLIAAYSFDEGSGTTAADITGNGHLAALSDQSWVAGKFGTGLEFSEDIVTIENAELLNPGAALTVSAWVKPLAQQYDYPTIVMKEGRPLLEEYAYGLLGERINEWEVVEPPRFGGAFEAYYPFVSGGTTPVDTWTHLASTYDGAELNFYVNGTLVDSTLVELPPGTTQPLSIGGNSFWGSESIFQGVIDEVRIYNLALSQSEVQAAMNAPLGSGGTTCTPVDDSNPCTLDDCDGSGTPTHTPVTDGTACADGDACTQTDTCQAGVCVGANPVVCTALDACHEAGTCEPATGACSNPAKPDGALCLNATVCDGTEMCQSGVCTSGTPLVVDDGNPCTADSCDAVGGVVNLPLEAGTSCTDTDACNGLEMCDGAGGCLVGTPPSVDDSNPCTVDTCDPLGGIIHDPAPEGTSCGSGLTCDASGICIGAEGPPPVVVAPPTDPTRQTAPADSWAFLHSGPNAIQENVAPGTIEEHRVALVTGKVLARDGNPVPNVHVTVAGLPEYGETRTRADGRFDLVVNGGGLLTIRLTKDGHLPVDRHVSARWEQSVSVPDIVMTTLDPVATPITLGALETQIAVGSASNDEDGTRQGVIVVPPDTHASAILPNGSAVPLDIATLRITEYTVGPDGPKAMPAPLPPTTAYTYAMEIGADEAVALGARTVEFDRAVSYYVENFLGFPVGEPVPVGYYDKDKMTWVPSKNGVVLKILAVNAGVADIDLDGDGLAEDESALQAIGLTLDERAQLGSLYVAESTLWRVPISHFTPWDCNWPYGPPQDAANDADSPPPPQDPRCGASQAHASIIECESQVLGETFPIPGTPFSLNYRSGRMPGYKGKRQIHYKLTGDLVPQGGSLVNDINVTISVAGRTFQYRYWNPGANLEDTFTWDGLDGFGRPVYGKVRANLEVRANFPVVYYPSNRDFEESFAKASAQPGVQIIPSRQTAEVGLTKSFTHELEGFFPLGGESLGGWTLNEVHRINKDLSTVFLGSGRAFEYTGHLGTVEHIAGVFPVTPESPRLPLDGTTDARAVVVGVGDKFAEVGPSGDVFFLHGETFGSNVYVGRVDRITNTYSTHLSVPGDRASYMQIADDGTVYYVPYASSSNLPSCVLRLVDAGSYTYSELVAGSCSERGFQGDGGPAHQARFSGITDFAMADDRTIYVKDQHRFRKIDPSGIVTTIIGDGSYGSFLPEYNNQLGTTVRASDPHTSMAAGPNGVLYIVINTFVYSLNSYYSYIVALGPDGVLRILAEIRGQSPLGSAPEPVVDGVLSGTLRGATVDQNGILYTMSAGHLLSDPVTRYFVLAIDPNTRKITTVAHGPVVPPPFPQPGAIALGQLPAYTINGLSASPDGSLYVMGSFSINRVKNKGGILGRIFSPEFGCDLVTRGKVGYCFDPEGMHVRTLDLRTGATLLTFSYDDGVLSSILDASGNVTSVGRAGDTISITAPGGQVTTIELDASGYATSISDGISTMHLEPRPDGLLSAIVDQRGFRHEYDYDSLGRLVSAEDASGSTQTLSLTRIAGGQRVERTTEMGRATSYDLVRDGAGATIWAITQPDGTLSASKTNPDGSIDKVGADGTVTHAVTSLDPVYRTPFVSHRTTTTPGSVTRSESETRTSVGDPLTSETITRSINGRPWTTVYTAADRTYVSTSPVGRTTTHAIDVLGRTVSSGIGSLLPSVFGYDSEGRLHSVARGNRLTTSEYETIGPSAGYLKSITAPDNVETIFTRDILGRATTETRAGSTTSYAWDPLGNMTSIVPPGKPAHGMSYTPVNSLGSYNPPSGSLPQSATGYTYDLDRMLTGETRPTGAVIGRTYEPTTGRLDTITLPGGLVDYDYIASSATNAAGKTSSITGPYGVDLGFTYDGPLTTSTTWSGDIAGSVAWQYNNDFLKTRETVTGSSGTSFAAFGYDNDLLLTCASPTTCSSPGADALTLTRSPDHGLITALTLGSTSETWTYNGYGELAIQSATFSSTPLVDITYDTPAAPRDLLGRIAQKTETIAATTHVYAYQYDAQRRLTDVTVDGVLAEEFTYDANGNRLTGWSPATGTRTGTYDDQDRLLTYGPWEFTYTANGELESKTNTVTNDEWLFQYDVLGNLLSVGLPNGDLVEYLVDGLGRRVGKKVNGVLAKQWLYRDALKPAAELDSAGNLVAQFVYGSKSNVPDYVRRGSATYRVISDQLGSPRYVVNVADSNDVPFTASYTSFGEVTGTGLDWMPFGFAGGIYDVDTGLIRFGARDYDPSTGRWVSKDPSLFAGQQPNLYVYADNDPFNRIDPDGHMSRAVTVHRWLEWLFERNRNRNLNNKCPPRVPTECPSGRDWTRSTRFSHAWRGSDGSECIYDSNGNLVLGGESFNYGPEPWSARHVFLDFFPGALGELGGGSAAESGQTQVCGCE